LVHRLDPGVIPVPHGEVVRSSRLRRRIQRRRQLGVCFGLKTGVATAMVDNGIGELIQRQVREMGVRPFYKHFEHDGVRGPNMATVYSDRGQGVRAPVVFYNRANEAGAMLKPGDFDWTRSCPAAPLVPQRRDLRGTCRNTTGRVVVEGMKAAGRPVRSTRST
jgi:2-dehydro-3-deoxygluconokinase